ncbi:amino acid/amide ABC transporter membrane protein 2, HAAT family [Archaeoglobus sulfaticallidus PM70-1]|uniref:Amino acid/amide ABC transporter membrane protein 2, HAAT family n=1 Tax=Archaeoglobus sulfaticallidus PM70-1 TaxID=387631 RepID=N0BHN9_9EURY|nr:branched-chain amino acid ABC transporter permease [Archaeoglobus sulfaticallidus]AGK61827.1 amino acid/amide ABC transporter membrane protein 2, HAAT family [Archaeoglobus sulfaticallidus PM70-1]
MIEKYSSLLPVMLIYAVLFLIGISTPGMWQPVAFIMFYITLGQAFNIFLGLTGYVDFGYVAFLALGAYGMALAFDTFASPGMGFGIIILGLILAIIMSSILSLAVGAVALRLRGAYFAIATIGVNEGFRYFIEGAKLWGGSEGIIISGDMRKMFGREMANYISTFVSDVLVFIIAILAAIVTVMILNRKMGYALMAVREDEDAAKVMGINVTKYKIMAFITSASFAGLIGATAWTLKMTYVFPSDVFLITYTVEAIVIVMLGGAGTLLGPIVGGLIYGILKYYLSIILPGFQLLILAPLLIVIIVAFPDGVVGSIKNRLSSETARKYLR